MTSITRSSVDNRCLSPSAYRRSEEENTQSTMVLSQDSSLMPFVSTSPACVFAKSQYPLTTQGVCSTLTDKHVFVFKDPNPEDTILNTTEQVDPCRFLQQTNTKIAKVKNSLQNSLDGLNLSQIRPAEPHPPLSIEEKISGLFENLQIHQQKMFEIYQSIESPPRLGGTSHELYFPIHFEGGSLRLVKLVGTGAFGKVYHAELLSDVSEKILDVALKISKVFKSREESLRTISGLKNEASLMKKISCRDSGESFPIAKVLSDFPLNSFSYCLVEELYECSLLEVLRRTKNAGVSLSLTYKIVKQLLSALEILETVDSGVVHCDLKPENIVLENSFSSKIKLIDFGMAVVGADQNLDKKYLVSRFYRSPEILFHLPFHTASDRWSLGLIAFELFAGRPLFLARDNLELVCKMDDFLGPLPESLSSEVANQVHPHFKKGSSIDLEEAKRTYNSYENPTDVFNYVFSDDYLRNKNSIRFDVSHTIENLDLFKSFIRGFLTLDPTLRTTIDQARLHPFMDSMEALLTSKRA